MRIRSLIIAALFCVIQLHATSAGDLIVPSAPAMRGSIHSMLPDGDKCISVPDKEFPQGARLELQPCQNGKDQIFDWNGISFEIKIFNLCVDALRGGDGSTQSGDPVGLWYCQALQRQKWYPIRNNANALSFRIIGGNPISRLCLTIRNDSKANATNLIVADCSNNDTQQFRFQSWPVVSFSAPSRPLGRVQSFSLR